jgi:hypothetical protein
VRALELQSSANLSMSTDACDSSHMEAEPRSTRPYNAKSVSSVAGPKPRSKSRVWVGRAVAVVPRKGTQNR